MANLSGSEQNSNTWLISIPQPTKLLHPLVIFSIVWLGVVSLYSLHLSRLLRYSTTEASSIVFRIWVPFAVTVCLCSVIHWLLTTAYPKVRKQRSFDFTLLRRRLKIWFRIWVLITIGEIIVSGGVPLFWALTHGSKIYTDFGIPSLHGLVNSLLLSIGLCHFLLFLVTKDRRELKIPMFILCWSVIIINRNLMLVVLMEFAIVYLRLRKVRVKTFFQIGVGILVFVLAFGVVGDIRQGSSTMIRDLAQPTDEYPDWLPSGVLWAYIYITTPINNLLYTVDQTQPANNLLFPNTVATLFPSVIRTVIYGNDLGAAESGELVVSAFNVSTAYIGPYQDFGYTGMILFSIMAALICQFFWFRNDLQSFLMLAVVIQCLAITLFFDHFFALPVISQLVWLWYLFLPRLRIGMQKAKDRPARRGLLVSGA